MSKKKDWFISSKIEIKTSTIPGAGLGVFSKEEISPGEVLERSPVTLFGIEALEELVESTNGQTILADIVFGWNMKTCAIAMGWGGLYNHALDCNVNWVALADHKAIEFYSKSRVSAGEELFIRYRHPHNPERDFEEEARLVNQGLLRPYPGMRASMEHIDDLHGPGMAHDKRAKWANKHKNRDGCIGTVSPGLSWKSNIKS